MLTIQKALIKHKLAILFCLFFIVITDAQAKKTQYVSDELVINMRSGKGTGFKFWLPV